MLQLNKGIRIRLSEEDLNKLHELANVYNTSASELVRKFINELYLQLEEKKDGN